MKRIWRVHPRGYLWLCIDADPNLDKKCLNTLYENDHLDQSGSRYQLRTNIFILPLYVVSIIIYYISKTGDHLEMSHKYGALFTQSLFESQRELRLSHLPLIPLVRLYTYLLHFSFLIEIQVFTTIARKYCQCLFRHMHGKLTLVYESAERREYD